MKGVYTQLCLLLGVLLLVGTCTAVLPKLIVGTCCNGDSTYPSQEAWIGQKFFVNGVYSEFCQSSFYDWAFSVILAQWQAGRVTHLTLSPQTSSGCSPTNFVPTDPNAYILSGQYDTYIAAFITHLTSFLSGPDGVLGNTDDRRMYIRLAHELNGNWYSWSGNSTSYQMMWRYVWNKVMIGNGFTKTHLQWIFEPVSPWEVDAAHDFRLYWPGDQYVDWMSLDAYNVAGQQQWYQPYEIFDSMLYKLRDWRPALPVAISETGSDSLGTSAGVALKSQWLTDLLPYLAGWNVQMVVYFNTNDGSDDWPYFWTTGNLGTADITESGTTYSVYSSWKSAVLGSAYELTSPTSPRIMTDDEFQGRLPGWQTKPALPHNLVIYNNGANYYDWQCSNAGYAVSLQDTTHPQSGETYAMSLTLTAWGSVQLHSSHLGANTSDYGSFQFSIYTTQANVALNLKPFLGSGASVGGLALTVATANTWTQFTYTWSQLGVPVGIMLQGLYIQGASNNNQGLAYFDGIQLLANPVNWPAGWPPVTTSAPTKAATAAPSKAPTAAPSKAPTAAPSKAPTAAPSKAPSAAPTKAPGFSTTFASVTSVDHLTGNAVESNGLTLQITSPSSGTYTGGQWQLGNNYGYGNFTFKVKSTSASGTAVLLWATASDTSGVFNGFQVGLQGNTPTSITLQTFGSSPFTWESFALGFDASAAYNTYTVSYTSVFKLYANGKLIVSTSSAPTIPLQMYIQLEESTAYFGPFSATLPVSAYASAASWTSV